MRPRHITTVLCFVVAAVLPARALVLPGGRIPDDPAKFGNAVDCWVGFEVADADIRKSNGKNKVSQKACCGGCSFHTKLCVNMPTPKCTALSLCCINAFALYRDGSGLTLPQPDLPTAAQACGSEAVLTVLEGEKALIQSSAGASTDPRYDNDRLLLICKKNKKLTDCPATCPAATAGGKGLSPR